EAASPRFIHTPGAIEVAAEALAYALHQHPHGLAGDLDETFDTQDIVLACRRNQAIDQRIGIANRGDRDDERVEIIVIVLALGVMVRGTGAHIVLRRRADPE